MDKHGDINGCPDEFGIDDPDDGGEDLDEGPEGWGIGMLFETRVTWVELWRRKERSIPSSKTASATSLAVLASKFHTGRAKSCGNVLLQYELFSTMACRFYATRNRSWAVANSTTTTTEKVRIRRLRSFMLPPL